MSTFGQRADARNTLAAELIGSNTCTAAGIIATDNCPVLALCRKMVEAGHDPATRLHVYRGDVLALTVGSIGAAAKLTVRESTKDGCPRFAPLSGDARPPVRKSGPAGVEGHSPKRRGQK